MRSAPASASSNTTAVGSIALTGPTRATETMRLSITLLCLASIWQAACTASRGASNVPDEVAEFVEQRDTCDHFRGEVPDPPSNERSREIAEEVRRFCTGTDARLAELKRRYVSSSAVLKKLDGYEVTVERKYGQ